MKLGTLEVQPRSVRWKHTDKFFRALEAIREHYQDEDTTVAMQAILDIVYFGTGVRLELDEIDIPTGVEVTKVYDEVIRITNESYPKVSASPLEEKKVE